MQITIEIDANLIAEAQGLSGSKNLNETIRKALELLIQMHHQQENRGLRGQLQYEDNRNQDL